jgi:hypothetical protein
MRLVWQWISLERELPESWSELRLVLRVREQDAARAAAFLGGLNPLRQRDSIRLFISRSGAVGPEALRRSLLRLDRQGIQGTLELAGTTTEEAEPAPTAAAPTRAEPTKVVRPLVEQWDEAVAAVPDDWSDMFAEVELRSSDHLERAALLMAPVNPTRDGDALALRFRVARRFGYGVSATMGRRCLERLEEERLPGELHVLGVLCDTQPVGTQGPVLRVGGRAV